MNYSDFSTKDFITDEKFIRWVNEPDESLDDFWESWLQKNPSKLGEIKEAKTFIQSLITSEDLLDDSEVNSILNNIHADIAEPNVKPIASYRIYKWVGSVAAIFLLTITILWFFGEHKTNYITQFNETQSLELPDGSSVVLNANSEILFDEKWEKEADREVWLSGEAFFHVTPTPSIGNRKFVVHTTDVDVEVLGTEFNVNARNEKTTVILTSGKIQLSTTKKENQKTIAVKPGERVLIENEKLNIDSVNTDIYTSWLNQKLVLDKTSFAHIIEILENNYGYKVNLKNPNLLKKNISGTVPIHKDPNILLRSLSTMYDLEIIKKENKELLIKLK